MTTVNPDCKANQKKKFNRKSHEQELNRNSNRVPHGELPAVFEAMRRLYAQGRRVALV